MISLIYFDKEWLFNSNAILGFWNPHIKVKYPEGRKISFLLRKNEEQFTFIFPNAICSVNLVCGLELRAIMTPCWVKHPLRTFGDVQLKNADTLHSQVIVWNNSECVLTGKIYILATLQHYAKNSSNLGNYVIIKESPNDVFFLSTWSLMDFFIMEMIPFCDYMCAERGLKINLILYTKNKCVIILKTTYYLNSTYTYIIFTC